MGEGGVEGDSLDSLEWKAKIVGNIVDGVNIIGKKECECVQIQQNTEDEKVIHLIADRLDATKALARQPKMKPELAVWLIKYCSSHVTMKL